MRALIAGAGALLLIVGAAHAQSPDETKIRKVIIEGNQGFIEASKSLDPGPLREWFEGQALVDLTKDAAENKEGGFYIVFDALRIIFESVTMDMEKGEATVLTTETWSGAGHDLGSGDCFSRRGPNKSRLTYKLKREGPRWKIFSSTQEPLGERTGPLPCDARAPAAE